MQNPTDRPDYKHPDYEALEPRLKLLQDVYDGLEGSVGDGAKVARSVSSKKALYLPKGEKEHQTVYAQRVERSVFNNKLRPTVESNAGLLTAFEVSGLPPSLEEAEKNVDLMGSDFKTFFQAADKKALTDGIAYIYVDYPPVAEGETAADQRGRRPHLKLIDRRNILNWRVSVAPDGQPRIEQITVLMYDEMVDGLFGIKREKRYHQFVRSPQGLVHAVWAIDEKNNAGMVGKPRAIAGLTEIPLVPYPFVSTPFPTENPPLLKMARLNIKLFQMESLKEEIEYRLCPTLKRIHPGAVPPQEELPAIQLGASWIIDIPNGGDVGVLSIPPDLVAPVRETIAETLQAIEGESLSFLAGSTVQRTATESFLSSAQISSSMNGYARSKSGAIARCVEMWAQYTGEDNSKLEIKMDQNVLEQPLDAGEVNALLGLWKEMLIDKRTALELLQMGRQLPPNADIDEILDRVNEEFSQQAAPQVLPDPFGLNGEGASLTPAT